MDKDEYKIAVASSDGIVVNNHFGRAKEFYIYQIDETEQLHFLEKEALFLYVRRAIMTMKD